MANREAIYLKTSKGTEAIANRQSGLAPKLRSLLIMVDGRRSHSELAGLAAGIGDSDGEQLLSQLVQAGLIESINLAPAASAAPDVSPPFEATLPQPLITASLPEAKRYASQLLEDTLGPTADELCIKIESAHGLHEFVSAVKRARDVIRDIKGGQAAAEFIEQVELRTPLT